jgi:Cu/Ag efflux protein CusF
MKQLSILVTALALGATIAVVQAKSPAVDTSHAMLDRLVLAQADAMSEGEVRKVDKDAKKITIKHGEIKNLAMPPMTMVFQVKDPALLDQLKPGDKVRFEATDSGGALVIVRLERAS